MDEEQGGKEKEQLKYLSLKLVRAEDEKKKQ